MIQRTMKPAGESSANRRPSRMNPTLGQFSINTQVTWRRMFKANFQGRDVEALPWRLPLSCLVIMFFCISFVFVFAFVFVFHLYLYLYLYFKLYPGSSSGLLHIVGCDYRRCSPISRQLKPGFLLPN